MSELASESINTARPRMRPTSASEEESVSRVGAAGPAARPGQAADHATTARAMMFGVGRTHARRRHPDRCPMDVGTRNPADPGGFPT